VGNFSAGVSQGLLEVLARARRRGLLGKESFSDAIERSLFFAKPFGTNPPETLVDVGSGGGIPGIPLLLHWPDTRGILLDRRVTSCSHLREALQLLGIGERVTVESMELKRFVAERTRDRAEAVVARGVGLEMLLTQGASRLVVPGGWLISSVPRELSDAEELVARFKERLMKAGVELHEIIRGPLEVAVFRKRG